MSPELEEVEKRRAYQREWHNKKYRESVEFRAKAIKNSSSWQAKNPDKKAAYNAKRTAEQNRTAMRKFRLRHKYGISVQEFEALFEAQGKVCAACNVDKPGGKYDWHVDHCHETGKVRGVLCHSCNTALAMAKENPERLRKLAVYAERCVTLRGKEHG